jgi:hypothetical protein
VGLGGYAIGYDIFEGNIYEGHKLIPFIEKITANPGDVKKLAKGDASGRVQW